MADYTRINYNISNGLLEEITKYTGSNGAGRSALLNYLVASALANKAVVEMLENRRDLPVSVPAEDGKTTGM